MSLLIGLTIAIGMSIAAAAVYASVTDSDGVAGLDRPVLQLAVRLRSPVVDHLAAARALIFGTIGLPIIAVTAIAVATLLMTLAGKSIVGRTRPPHADAIAPFETSPSFPSGHSLKALVVLGVIAYVLWLHIRGRSSRRLIVVLAAAIAVLVGLSRILLGTHWFTDVLASWALGCAWLALIVTFHRAYEQNTRPLT